MKFSAEAIKAIEAERLARKSAALQGNEQGRIALVHDVQARFAASKAFFVGFVGGRGAGKTYIGSYKVLTQAKKDEPWMCVSPDSGVVLDTTLPTFLDVCRKYKKLIRYVKSPYPRVWFKTQDGGEANIIMRSGEKPDKLRGPNKAGLWIDEASVQTEDVYEIAIATLRIEGAANQVFLTFTPRGRHHWTFHRFYEPLDDYEVASCSPGLLKEINGSYFRQKPDTELFHAPSYKNPFLPEGYADRLTSQYTSAFAKQEVEGDFVDLAGLLFSRSDFSFIDVGDVPRNAARIRYWDRAATEGGGSYTVGLLMARDMNNRFIVENVVRGQWSPARRKKMMLETAQTDAMRYDNEVIIYCEQEGGSGGVEQMNQDVMMLAGYPVYRDKVSGAQIKRKDGLILPGRAKVTRAAPFAAMVENGGVYLVKAKWNQAYLDELVAFPESNIADQVDGSSGAFNKLAFRGNQHNFTATQLKADELHSKAARLLSMARETGRRRGIEEANPRTGLARITSKGSSQRR